jgi:hypothetical protein
VKRNKELIATNIQEIFNGFAVAQISQPIDLNQLFMHQLQQQQILPSPGQQANLDQLQLQILQQQQQFQQAQLVQAQAQAQMQLQQLQLQNLMPQQLANPQQQPNAPPITQILNGTINYNGPLTMNGAKLLPSQQLLPQQIPQAVPVQQAPVRTMTEPQQQQSQYANGNDNEKFKMHQGFIAVLKVSFALMIICDI